MASASSTRGRPRRRRPAERRARVRGACAARRRRRSCEARSRRSRAERARERGCAQVARSARQRPRGGDGRLGSLTGKRSRSAAGISSRSSTLEVITTEKSGPGRTHSRVSGLRQRADSGESVIASSVARASPEARSTSSSTSRPPRPLAPAPRANRRTLAPLEALLAAGHPRAGDLARGQVFGADESSAAGPPTPWCSAAYVLPVPGGP